MRSLSLTRRTLLRLSALTAGALLTGNRTSPQAWAAARDSYPWPLRPAPSLPEVLVPPGADARIVARSSVRPISGSQPASGKKGYPWHGAPDGGAVFPHPEGGWVYVSNSEMPRGGGGVGALRFNPRGDLVAAYGLLSGTSRNCAGGATPWGTWLSCEEVSRGQVWECDPFGRRPAKPLPALGRFNHEALAVDPAGRRIYLTEDLKDGLLYRFTPGRWPDLAEGALEAAAEDPEGSIVWLPVPDPSGATRPTRSQVPGALRFQGGEGIVVHKGRVSFATKYDNRVWEYDPLRESMAVRYDAATHPKPILKGVDNLTVTPGGLLLVAEDGDDQQIVALTPGGTLFPVVQVLGHRQSELTGPAFDPSGTRLYFSSQRGSAGDAMRGVTFEVSGMPVL